MHQDDLPIAWRVETACDSEHEHMPSLLDTAIRRGFTPDTCAMDTGYDGSGIRRVDIRRVRHQAGHLEVALPDR